VWANWTLGIGGADSTSRTEESAAMTGSRDSSKRRDSAFPEHRIRRSRARTPAPTCRRKGRCQQCTASCGGWNVRPDPAL